MGYQHPSGEVHIMNNNQWASCPGKKKSIIEEIGRFADHKLSVGQDNTNSNCIVGEVKNIFEGKVKDHVGPYDGVTMGSGC